MCQCITAADKKGQEVIRGFAWKTGVWMGLHLVGRASWLWGMCVSWPPAHSVTHFCDTCHRFQEASRLRGTSPPRRRPCDLDIYGQRLGYRKSDAEMEHPVSGGSVGGANAKGGLEMGQRVVLTSPVGRYIRADWG